MTPEPELLQRCRQRVPTALARDFTKPARSLLCFWHRTRSQAPETRTGRRPGGGGLRHRARCMLRKQARRERCAACCTLCIPYWCCAAQLPRPCLYGKLDRVTMCADQQIYYGMVSLLLAAKLPAARQVPVLSLHPTQLAVGMYQVGKPARVRLLAACRVQALCRSSADLLTVLSAHSTLAVPAPLRRLLPAKGTEWHRTEVIFCRRQSAPPPPPPPPGTPTHPTHRSPSRWAGLSRCSRTAAWRDT